MRFIILLAILFTNHSFAGTCSIATSGHIDNLIIEYCNNMLQYMNHANKLAHFLFTMLFSLEFLWQLTVRKVFLGDLERLWVFFFTRIVLGLFFAHYIINVNSYRNIIEFICRYVAVAGGFHFDSNPSLILGMFHGVTPSTLISYFYCASDIVHTGSDSSSIVSFIGIKILLAVSLLLLFVVLMSIAYLMLEVFIKTYFLLYVGFFLTGFAGSSWTMSFWELYLKSIFAISFEFLVQCVLLSVLRDETKHWILLLNEAAHNISALSGAFLNMLGVALIFLMLIHSIPKWFSRNLVGKIHVNLSDRFQAVSGFLAGKY